MGALQESLLKFTEFAIRQRIQFRKNNPVQEINDMLAIQAGLTPGIADQNKLKKNIQLLDELDDADDDEDDVGSHSNINENKILSAEEGDGFAGAIYSGSRFRGASLTQNNNAVIAQPGNDDLDDIKAPPPAYSDYGSDDE